jgi:hypothetical protein
VAPGFRGRLVRAACWVAFLGLPNLILFVGHAVEQPLRELTARGVCGQGSVLGKRIVYRSKGGSTHFVRYSYTVGGRSFTREDSVSPQDHAGLNEGSSCQVYYLPDHPETCCLGRPGPQLQRGIASVLFLAGIAGGICAGFLVYFEARFRRERALAREGEPILGRITDHGVAKSKNGVRYWARYCFTASDGEERTSWHYIPQFVYDELPLGIPVTVLVAPVNAGRHLPLYAFKDVRILQEPVN